MHAAYDLFAVIGAEAFAERARRELLATGEKVRKREVDTHSQLTPQEEHIARLARDGRTNPEIAAELFISTRTVEWHLRKVFAKLGITSRRDLHNACPREVSTRRPARSLVPHWGLLHGFPEFWYAWRQQIGPLAAAGFRACTRTRGYNLSSKPDGVEPTTSPCWPPTSGT